MIKVRVGDKFVQYSALSWSAADPGGFESCSFVVERSSVTKIAPNDPIFIFDDLEVAWHGIVEEPGLRSDHGHETYNVAGVGYGAKLKNNPYSMIYIDRALGEFRDAPLARNIQLSNSGSGFVYGENCSFSVLPGETQAGATAGYPALVIQFNNISTTAARHPIMEVWYDAGSGNVIDQVYSRFESYDKSGGTLSASWQNKIFLSDNETTTNLDVTANLLGAVGEVTLNATGTRKWVGIQLYYNAVIASTAGDWKWMLHDIRIHGKHDVPLVGIPVSNVISGVDYTTYGTEGYYASDIVEDAVKRSGLEIDKIIDDAAGYIIQHLVFRTPETPEAIIDRASRFVGWHWGVWEPRSIHSTTPTFYFQAPPQVPTTAVKYADCDSVDLSEKLSDMYNTAVINYSLPNGTQGTTRVTKTHPRISDEVVQTVVIDVGTVGSAAAAATIGTYQLALLQDATRTAGSLMLPQKLMDGRAAHLIRPGRDKLRLLGMPSLDKLIVDNETGAESFRIRRISVNVEKDQPRTQIEFDHGADLIEVLQARLTNAAEARNLA